MTFRKWILRFKDVELPIGDLARDVSQDPDFPESCDLDTVQSYLESKGIADAPLCVFEYVWKFYKDDEA